MRFSGELVTVTNREPYMHEKSSEGVICKKSIGGVVSAIDSLMVSRGGTWIAWGSGKADFEIGDVVEVPCDTPRYRLKRVKLSEKETELYYRGFCNRTLWPVFHLFTERAVFSTRYWKSYVKVNTKFAKATLDEAHDDSFVWVHDYHLSLVPSMIRSEARKIGFFWHIPWAPWSTFSKIPWRDEIFSGLLGSDLIGFHTMYYARNFLECAEELGYQVKRRQRVIYTGDRAVKVGVFPIGVNYQLFNEMKDKVKSLRSKIRVEKLIFGLDRLDYTKGILERLLAFELFLENNPQWHGRVSLVQVATPSRTKVEEYRLMKREIDECVGRINGAYSTLNWTPVRYFYQTIPFETLVQYYKAADVALVTPIVDGMNLVVKEYIATKDAGVVILSEFAGAAEDLTEAIIVNPHDINAVAEAIKNAVEMGEEEKKRRFLALKRKVRRRDINWWIDRFFHEWEKLYSSAPSRQHGTETD
jgi:trehalose 6-phosphate synthase